MPCDAEDDEVEDPPPTLTHVVAFTVGFIDGIVFPIPKSIIGLPSRRARFLRSLFEYRDVNTLEYTTLVIILS